LIDIATTRRDDLNFSTRKEALGARRIKGIMVKMSESMSENRALETSTEKSAVDARVTVTAASMIVEHKWMRSISGK
jgi:hypothetical protein